jgi:hypothetical protein
VRWRQVRGATRAALGLLLVAGCSSSSHVTTTPAASTGTTSRPGGFIGAIDAARVAAVCANARAAQTVLAGGAGGSGGADALVAAAVLLERPPVDPGAAAVAVTIRTDLRSGHADAALAAALSFCHDHGG